MGAKYQFSHGSTTEHGPHGYPPFWDKAFFDGQIVLHLHYSGTFLKVFNISVLDQKANSADHTEDSLQLWS